MVAPVIGESEGFAIQDRSMVHHDLTHLGEG
jgi:hypothetical protein